MKISKFAGLALAQELSLNGRSISFLYYLSVHYFLQNQHESAISHLKEIESTYGLVIRELLYYFEEIKK